MSTLLQDKTIELLPANNFKISPAMRQAGYTDSTSKNGTHIAVVRELAKKKYFDEEFIRKQYKATLKQTEQSKDIPNKLRTLEGMARIEGLFKDNKGVKGADDDDQAMLERYGIGKLT